MKYTWDHITVGKLFVLRIVTWRGVMVIVLENGHGDTSSNPGWDWLHFTKH